MVANDAFLSAFVNSYAIIDLAHFTHLHLHFESGNRDSDARCHFDSRGPFGAHCPLAHHLDGGGTSC